MMAEQNNQQKNTNQKVPDDIQPINLLEKIVQRAIQCALDARFHSQPPKIDGTRVGAAIIAKDHNGKAGIFVGSNIALTTDKGYHAEQVALMKAISSGFLDIVSVFVTSETDEERAAMCEYCRGDFMAVNPDVRICVINPSSAVLKIDEPLSSMVKYPYLPKKLISWDKVFTPEKRKQLSFNAQQNQPK